MTAVTIVRISRTYRRVVLLAGQTDEETAEVLDVSSFNPTVEFNVDDGGAPTDPFHLTRGAWDKLGRPDRIAVYVERA